MPETHRAIDDCPQAQRSHETECERPEHSAVVASKQPAHTGIDSHKVSVGSPKTPVRTPKRIPHTTRTRFARWKRHIPSSYPQYNHAAGHHREKQPLEIYPKIDAIFVLLATCMSVAVGWIFLREGLTTNPLRLINLVIFWVVFTYVALPRIHQTLTTIYVPDYFIGRTRTADGLLGDPVNLAFEGSAMDIHVAMRRAGWALAEENTLHSARKMVTAFLLRRSYSQAPVSPLFLFGRRHEFAYQQEVGGTTVKRHHIRFWRSPQGWVLPGGHRVTWLGAATYDRSVGLSRFTWQVTHKIDENTDLERDYVVDTLLYADPEISVGVIRDYSTSYHHRNGGGDPLRTDGHLPVVDVSGAQSRSCGSTAILQPRHLATGISFLKGRSIHLSKFLDTVKEGWHGTVEDVDELFAQVGDHHIPPPSVLFVGAMILCELGALAYLWFVRLWTANADAILATSATLDLANDPLPSITGVVLLQIACFIGVVRRNRWARLLLMAVLALDSGIRIPEAWAIPVGDVGASDLLGLGLSSLALLVLTSDAARIWVHTDRLARESMPRH